MSKQRYTKEDIILYNKPCPSHFRDNISKVCFGKYFIYDDLNCYKCTHARKCFCLCYDSKETYDRVKALYKARRYERQLNKVTYVNHIQLIAVILTYTFFDTWTYKEIAQFVFKFWKKYYKEELRISAQTIAQLLSKNKRLKALRNANKKQVKRVNPLTGFSNEQETNLRQHISELKETGML